MPHRERNREREREWERVRESLFDGKRKWCENKKPTHYKNFPDHEKEKRAREGAFVVSTETRR